MIKGLVTLATGGREGGYSWPGWLHLCVHEGEEESLSLGLGQLYLAH